MAVYPLKVLVVEDEISIRNLMEMEFQDLGYETLVSGTVAESLDLLENLEIVIDLCIFDLRLPDGDGLTLLQKTHALRPQVPVILMTGHGNKSTVIEALKRGAYDYIEKPFSISNDLFPVIHRAEETVRLQKENSSLNEQILHQSKLAVLGELSATVMHDIRGPLGLIRMVCDDMVDEVENIGMLNSSGLNPHVLQIQKACDRIGKLVEHLRGYSRQDKQEALEQKTLGLLVEDSLFLVSQKIRKIGVEVEILFNEEDANVLIECYPNKFEQSLMNLCSNACDAMKEREVKKLTLKAEEKGGFFYLHITDTGTGMSPQIQEKIFESFFTTKNRSEGTGLGLKIVRNIIHEHEGELLLESTEGKGTTFSIKLPSSKISFPVMEESHKAA